MAPVASADVMGITKWSISRLESGMAGCCAYAASGQALSAKCTRRHLRIKMKELMALAAGLPTIFQDREDVAAGKACELCHGRGIGRATVRLLAQAPPK
jgi:hypothetical protein